MSDHQAEYQIGDRLSFMRFLGLALEDVVSDEKALWAYREVLAKGGVVEQHDPEVGWLGRGLLLGGQGQHAPAF